MGEAPRVEAKVRTEPELEGLHGRARRAAKVRLRQEGRLVTAHVREVVGGLTQARLIVAGVMALVRRDAEERGEDGRVDRCAHLAMLDQVFDALGRIRSEYRCS